MISSILVAIDGSKDALDAMDVAVDLAKGFGCELTLVHVVSGGAAYRAPSGIQEYAELESIYISEQEILEGVAETITAEAVDLATARGLTQPEVIIRPGQPAEAIVDVAQDIGADLIVVGNRGLTGMGRMLTGSVSNAVNHLAACSVLTVR